MNLLGKISLTLSLICFLLTAGFRLALSGWIPFIGWGLGFSVFFFLFALAINFKYIKSLLKSESLHFVSKSLITSLLVIIFAVLLNFIVFKKNLVVDLTENKIHSLSTLTQALVKALPQDLTFYYFHVGNDRVRGFESTVREALNPYLELSPKIKFESHSIFKRPDLAKKFKTGNEESSLFMEYKGRIHRVADLSEPAITNGLLRLTKKPKVIYFLEGHDERSIEDNSTFGLKGVKEQLERLHYKVSRLKDLTAMPEDAAALVIMGPRLPFVEAEISNLRNYLQGGGALLVGLDPGENHKLANFVDGYGILWTGTYAYSKQSQAGQSPWLVLTHRGKSNHEISESHIEGVNPALFIAGFLQANGEHEESKVSSILEHLPNTEMRKDLAEEGEGYEAAGLTAAAVSEGLGENAYRMIVVADSDFMTNQYYIKPGNFDFILSLVTYLSKDEDLLKMKLPVPKTTYLIMTQTQMNLYFLFFVLPFSVLFFLVALFFKLRRYF